MPRSRSLLHKSKLQLFEVYCIDCGWVSQPCNGVYEVLRMRRQGNRDPLIVYTKAVEKEHFTTHGIALQMVEAFLYANNISADKEDSLCQNITT